jgi:hypothetical protein
VVQPYREKKIHPFDTLSDFIDFSEQPLCSDVAESMSSLASQLSLHFPLCSGKKKDWMKTPFLDSEYELPSVEGEQLIELSSDSTFKMLFPSLPLLEFWFEAKSVYPEISKRALRHLLPFAATYLCETTFFSFCIHE